MGFDRDLKQRNVTSVWTTISFVYPLLFESGETLAVSNEIFETPYRVYPEGTAVARAQTKPGGGIRR